MCVMMPDCKQACAVIITRIPNPAGAAPRPATRKRHERTMKVCAAHGELDPGTVVGGRWRVVYRIDSGGSSIVYLVVEIGGRERTAALKIRRMDTDQPKELFENEIRILRD